MISHCLKYALEIQRNYKDISEWKAAIETVPEYCREECRGYLREMARRKNIKKRALSEII